MSQQKKSSCLSFLKCCQTKQPSNYEERAPTFSNEVHPETSQHSSRGSRQLQSRSQDHSSNRNPGNNNRQNDARRALGNGFEQNNSMMSQQNLIVNTSHHNQQPLQMTKKQPNIFIETQHKLEDIECCDFVPQDRQVRYSFKYYCPVCLRYFNHILASQCCFNYMCHFCADEQMERERNIDKFVAKCPYNCEGKFELKDVTPNMQVKRYSDSQFMSFYSNNLGKNTAGGFGKFGKENTSPQIVKNLTSENFNNNKTKNTFINSANGFMRPYQDQNSLQLQEDEESKRQMMMHRSDAMQYAQRLPLNQIRANIIRQANQGFVMQSNTMTINNGGDDAFSQPPVDQYYDQDNYQFQSPQSRQNFNQNIDGISAIDLPGGQGVHTYNSSVGFQGFNEYTDYNIQSQGFEVQGPQFINVENNFSPQQQISQDRDDLSSIEEDDDDLDREHH